MKSESILSNIHIIVVFLYLSAAWRQQQQLIASKWGKSNIIISTNWGLFSGKDATGLCKLQLSPLLSESLRRSSQQCELIASLCKFSAAHFYSRSHSLVVLFLIILSFFARRRNTKVSWASCSWWTCWPGWRPAWSTSQRWASCTSVWLHTRWVEATRSALSWSVQETLFKGFPPIGGKLGSKSPQGHVKVSQVAPVFLSDWTHTERKVFVLVKSRWSPDSMKVFHLSRSFSTTLIDSSLPVDWSQVLVNSNLGCKVSGFRPLQEDKIEAIYTTLVSDSLDSLWFLPNEDI